MEKLLHEIRVDMKKLEFYMAQARGELDEQGNTVEIIQRRAEYEQKLGGKAKRSPIAKKEILRLRLVLN